MLSVDKYAPPPPPPPLLLLLPLQTTSIVFVMVGNGSTRSALTLTLCDTASSVSLLCSCLLGLGEFATGKLRGGRQLLS